jgi:hypothetical protein
VRLPVAAGQHDVRGRADFCGSPTETLNIESGGERHLMIRPSPVPVPIALIWRRSTYLQLIDEQTGQPLTGSARLQPWYLRSVVGWAVLLVGYSFLARVAPNISGPLFPSWLELAILVCGLAAASVRALRRNRI